ncbi:hypothetical protein [Kineococcus gypseus]|uniref:hypothetical protein n=1 Tax=Kineococcus gypseus TaxID=1637102 RepID=UPI003D7DB026
MGVDLGRGAAQVPEPGEGEPTAAAGPAGPPPPGLPGAPTAPPGTPGAPPAAGAAVPVRSSPPPVPFHPRPPSPPLRNEVRGDARGAHPARRGGDDDEAREIEELGVDESRLTPLGATLPRVGFVPDAVLQAVRFGWMGLWITLYAVGLWAVALVVMFAWIGANGAYEAHKKELRRRRRRELRALRAELAGGPPAVTGGPGPAGGRGRRALRGAPAPAPQGPPPVPPPPFAARRVPEADPPVTDAERALLATVHRVDTSGRFERADVVLVHEAAELLSPLLLRVAERGADPRVRHDLETLATEHLPRTVDDYLALPADYAREHRTAAGTTPAEELRSQLHLLLEGARRLRDAVHDADVERQQQQSRFLESKFRRGELDL